MATESDGLRILFVAKGRYASVGGTENQLRLFARDLAGDHHVSVVEWRKQSTLGKFWRDLARRPGIASLIDGASRYMPAVADDRTMDGRVEVHSLRVSELDLLRLSKRKGGARSGRYADRQGDAAFQLRRSLLLPKLRSLARRHDVIHSMTSGTLAWMAQEAARLEGIPFLVTPFLHPDRREVLLDRAEFCKTADLVFALSDSDADVLAGAGVDRARIKVFGVTPVVPDAADPRRFRERHALGDNPVILFVGRMVEEKGAEAVIGAAPLVWRSYPHARFVFIGPHSADAQRWFANLDERISYLGLVDEQEKGDAFAACDVFCMPSESEILPTVYLEAWSFGKAVIGGRAHGLKELIEGNRAGLVADRQPMAVADGILRLLGDAALRAEMGQRGKSLVERSYSRRALAHMLADTYRRVRLGERAGALA